jgi:hypothetical protein
MIPVVSNRRGRVRRVAKWAALAACVLLAAAWVQALVSSLSRYAPGRGGWWAGVYVFLPLPAAFLAALVAVVWWRGRRPPPTGRCGVCGYDRAGLPPRAACPECGSTPG